jgi:putative oxidoreductase
MNEFIKHLLYSDLGSEINNLAMFGYRWLLAIELFRVHGLKKFRQENGEREHVPNPLGLPDKLNGLIATFADTVVPVLLILGVATRVAILPTLVVTAIGYFVVHREDSLEIRDVPYIYTLSLLLLLVLGPGIYSVDHLLFINF